MLPLPDKAVKNNKMEKKTTTRNRVPVKLKNYIAAYFSGDLVPDVKVSRNRAGNTVYKVAITHEGALYNLRFDHEGKIQNTEKQVLRDTGDDNS